MQAVVVWSLTAGHAVFSTGLSAVQLGSKPALPSSPTQDTTRFSVDAWAPQVVLHGVNSGALHAYWMQAGVAAQVVRLAGLVHI